MSNINQYTPTWLSDTTANKYVKTYFNSFIDVSGGDVIIRGTGKIYNDDLVNKLNAKLNIIDATSTYQPKTDMTNYKTIASFNTDIANYKTTASFNTDIANYLTTANATTT